ncbi:Lipase (class 3) [Caulifigura coniformis]|uniref:Lipase (Class 3) n=1 Tax=Caulifigura coniformis TaxID=2527983 RepID=A0A517SA61_9PLAN|nr:lipase family protein [Caulifigura coniformis]QDT53008.1 Lipase (class 3) [Caulifigura coniformis]
MSTNRKSLAIALVCAVWLAGCPAAKKPAPKPDQGTKPKPVVPEPLPAAVASFDELATPPAQGDRIRWKTVLTLATLANISYDEAPDQVAHASVLGTNVVVRPLSKESSEGFVAADERAVVISFRGTKGLADIVTDIKGLAKDQFGGHVHSGFSKALDVIYDDAAEAAIGLGARSKTVWITGHSLGGALATAFTLKALKEEGISVHGIVTFGQPLVMSENLCGFLHDTFNDRYLRIVNQTDPITRLIPKYRHAGARAQLTDDGNYEWRPPGVAPTGPASEAQHRRRGRLPEGRVVDIEPKSELELMSEDEMRELDRQVRQAHRVTRKRSARRAPPEAVGAWDPLTYHYMDGYIEKIRALCNRPSDRPSAVGDADKLGQQTEIPKP